MHITLLKSPTTEDWMLCKRCALVTVGKDAIKEPSAEWKHEILRAKHSPIRVLQFAFLMQDIPYYISVHLARHIHAQPFVRSQRNDRQDAYDRNSARQDAPVDMIWYMNAEELMTIAEKRLCGKADPQTQRVVRMMCAVVLEKYPEFEGLLATPCVKYGTCMEIRTCGRWKPC